MTDKEPMDVLVVDEDNAFANVVAHALRKAGHKVCIARTGEEALAFIEKSPPRLVLIDLMMPIINGLQLLLVLKSESATSHIPAIVWTATATEDITRQALAFGADAMLIKTRFSMGELRRLVSRLIRQGSEPDAQGRAKHILVVEDDDGTREAVAVHLKTGGYAVTEAENGWEALLMLHREQIDLVVLDLVMPGMDGPTFLRILRNGQKNHDLPVVVLTAHDIPQMRQTVDPLGVDHIMGKKPPMWDDLLPAVAKVLEAA